MAYMLDPEVAGGWGAGTVADTSCHPPKVNKLTYEFEGWSGDDLLTTFPCFIVTQRLADLIENASLSGYILVPVDITKSEIFTELYSKTELPSFKWFQVHGIAGNHDFAINNDHQLVVSEAAFSVISRTSIKQCEITKC